MKLEPATNASETISQYRAHVSEGMAMLAELMEAHVEVRSEGTRIWDEEGTEYLDCGGYGVFILGHRYPRVVAAVREQLDRHPMSSRVLLNGELAHAAEQLARVAPDGLEYVFFTNSGAEAAELAIKLARVNGRRRLISTHGGFHGKTNGALSVTGKAMFRDPFQPGLADVSFVAFDDVDALEAELAAGDPAAVILEPIQAEGGVIIPADGYLRAVRELCDRHGALLILDEVQTGLGRLGSWWGADRAGVVPDILLVGKGLSGGVVPVAAVVATADAYQTISEDPLLHSSTYAGNPLAMSAASAAITALEEDDIIPRAQALGARLLDELKTLKQDHAPTVLADVRGCGLLLAFDFHEDHFAGDFVLELLNRHVIVSTSLNANRVVRLHPAAIMDEADIEWLLGAMRESADAVEKDSVHPVRSTEMNAHLSGVSASEAFDRLADFASYAELAPSIRSIEIEKIDEQTLRTTWNVSFRGGSMRWVEEDRLDPEAGRIDFDLLDGNLKEFKGSWAVTEADGGSDVRFLCDFAVGMPAVSSLLDPLAERAIRDNIKEILKGLFGEAYEPKD